MFKKSPLAACIKQNEDTYILGYGTKQTIVDKNLFSDVSKILFYLEQEKSTDEIVNFLNQNNINNDVFELIVSQNLVTEWTDIFERTESIDFKNKLYIETIFKNGPQITQEFSKTTFIIVGCGGIGNFISYSLSSYNPYKMILVDGDIIEKSNLNRQFLFSNKDLGDYKTDVLKRELESINPDLNISTKKSYINSKILEDIILDEGNSNLFIILSGDSEGIVEDVTRVAVQYEISFLNIGYLNDISIIGPFYIPHKTSCPYCADILVSNETDNDITKEINNTYSAPSSFINNSFASSMATMDILHYFSGDFENINSLNKRLGLSNSNFEKLHLDIKKNDGCGICGTKQTIN